MKKFLVLYYASTEAREKMETSSPEEMKKGMEPWMAWKDKLGDALVDMGTPLGHAMSVTKTDTMPGDVSINGYSIIQAEDIDAAVALVKDHPHLHWAEDCEIGVYELMPTPGM